MCLEYYFVVYIEEAGRKMFMLKGQCSFYYSTILHVLSVIMWHSLCLRPLGHSDAPKLQCRQCSAVHL